jgi:two-component system, chemotaxis family, response regulator PixG
MIASPTQFLTGTTAEPVVQALHRVADQQGTCVISAKVASGNICLYIVDGQLVWAESEHHRWRRWYRLLRRAGIEPSTIAQPQSGYVWEYAVLADLVANGRIAAVESLIEQHLFEVLFDLFHEANSLELQPQRSGDLGGDLGVDPLATFATIETLQRAMQRHQDWQERGLKSHSPNLAPLIRDAEELQRQTNPQTYQMLTQLVRGQLSLRDLAAVMQQDLQIVVNVLLPYVYRDVIVFQPIADLAAPEGTYNFGSESKAESLPPATTYPSIPRNSISILCIDDNLQVCEILGRIISAAGYHYHSIQDSIEAIPTLLEHKPDLIFLDLVMPIASGYEVCSQIRRVSAFKTIPVVILTGNDGIIDRIRSKACGATDFIAKPLEAAKVLAAIKRHVPVRQ